MAHNIYPVNVTFHITTEYDILLLYVRHIITSNNYKEELYQEQESLLLARMKIWSLKSWF